jgi:Chlorophyll A-B binding protein
MVALKNVISSWVIGKLTLIGQEHVEITFENATKCKVQIIKKEVFLMISQPQPSISPKLEEPKFGFNEYAERLNGRAAMIGFVIMVVIEYVTHKGVLAWLGLN